MESLKRLASVRRGPAPAPGSTTPPPATSHAESSKRPGTAAAATGVPSRRPTTRRQRSDPTEPPRIRVERADSIIVDMSDPTAALASAATEMVTSLVRRAKSTRETRRERRNQSISGNHDRDRPRSLDLPSHPSVRPVPQRSRTVGHKGKSKYQSPNQSPDATPALNGASSASMGLKKRPSLRDRFKSRLAKPVAVIPTALHEEPPPKTPTDPRFVYRPKHAAADYSTLATSLQVPRDSQDDYQTQEKRRSSIEKKGLHEERAPVSLFDAPYPSPPLVDAPFPSPRLIDDTTPRLIDVPVPSPRLIDVGAPSPRLIDVPAPSPRLIDVPAPSPPLTSTTPMGSPPLVSPRAKGECSRCHSKRIQREQSVRQLTGEVPPRVLPADAPNPPRRHASSEKQPQQEQNGAHLLAAPKGHTKQAPSWASYHDGDSDGDKVQEHRKSQMQPLVSAKHVSTAGSESGRLLLQPQVQVTTVRRQRSVAQRIVDKFRGSGGRRGVKGVQVLTT